MPASKVPVPKHQVVYRALEREILEGKYRSGQKLPSEAALVRRFGVSRITAGRAVRDLQRNGFVERRAGSGTYVGAGGSGKSSGLVFGLLIPNLGDTEIFEPICRGMSSYRRSGGPALLWGNTAGAESGMEEQAFALCRQYIAKKVAGVFFAPLELTPGAEAVNLRLLSELEEARIPVVLLDRCVMPYPRRCAHDLVGIDNRRAGYIITEHLTKLGCRRIGFVTYRNSASTVDARIAGYREACFVHNAAVSEKLVARMDAGKEESEIEAFLKQARPEALVCANDRTAGRVMQALIAQGYKIPRDVRVTGIDDVAYARLLPVALTTVHQPVHQIGEVAMAAMLERVDRPETPVRDLLLGCEVVVRRSCGAASR